jgi:uncharacterized protein (TIGR03437 family)
MRVNKARAVRLLGGGVAVAMLLMASVTIEIDGDFRVVRSDGLPDHETGTFPSGENPNSISAQNYNFRIPLNPVMADTKYTLPLGPIAVATNGVPFFSMYTANYQNAVEGLGAEFLDSCNGHPQQRGAYHYHGVPKCRIDDTEGQHSDVVGWAFDGFAIYGPQGEDGTPPRDLDQCGGHIDESRGHHYHVSDSFPYSIGCYSGEVETSNLGPANLVTPFLTSANASSYDLTVAAGDAAPAAARDSIVAAFGGGLADSTVNAGDGGLPTELGGSRVDITQSNLAGGNRQTTSQGLYFVSPNQVNYHLSTNLSDGGALVEVINGSTRAAGVIHVEDVAPGLFSIDGSGSGAGAGFAAVGDNYTELFRTVNGAPTTHPISIGGQEVYLVLYGTGFRNATDVAVTVNGIEVPVTYSGEQSEYAGLDQLNAGPLPASLAGAGVVEIKMTAGGRTSNTVTCELD